MCQYFSFGYEHRDESANKRSSVRAEVSDYIYAL
jgi:hypothetical protein